MCACACAQRQVVRSFLRVTDASRVHGTFAPLSADKTWTDYSGVGVGNYIDLDAEGQAVDVRNGDFGVLLESCPGNPCPAQPSRM